MSKDIYEFEKVEIGRLDGDDSPNYEIYGLPAGKDFRSADSYERLTASWLKINGYGFACDGMEISEHGKTVEVEQNTEGGSARIRLE